MTNITPILYGQRLTISVKEFCQLSGMGKTKANQLIRDGKLTVTRVGRRTLISFDSALALIAPGLRDAYLGFRLRGVCSDASINSTGEA